MNQNNWEWCGPNNQSKKGISEERARALVASRGGTCSEMPELEPILPEAARPAIRPPEAYGEPEELFYRRGRYTGD